MRNTVEKTIVGIGCLPWIFVFMVIWGVFPLTILTNNFVISLIIGLILSVLITIGIVKGMSK
jgi:hypothetical protein